MAAPQVSTIIKTVTRRAWSDIEPKLIAWGLTGVSATGIISFASDYLHLHVTLWQAGLAVTIIGTIAGYLKKSTAKTEIPAPAPVVAPVEVAPVVQAPAA
jgi:hypothetical protein